VNNKHVDGQFVVAEKTKAKEEQEQSET